jgi:hypothetical protein
MLVTIRFEGKSLSFEKTVALDLLPDVTDRVRVSPVGNWVEMFGDEPVNGIVQERTFVEIEAVTKRSEDGNRTWHTPATLRCILDVRQA